MMDKHKDNYCPEELEKIIDRKFNNVILFSAGGNIPMTSKMCYPSRHEQNACREATESNISLCFLLVMAGSLCWIPSDDILMFRIVFFAESSRHDTKGYRVAWVMHWLAQTLDYFVDTCGLRCTKTKAMMDKYDHQTTCDSKHLETERSIFSSIKSLLLFSVTCILG